MHEILARRGPVAVRRVDFARYVGAKIGIYNPSGVKTGTIGRLKNQELIFIVACDGELPAGLRALTALPELAEQPSL
jgi:adenine-specific DNA-methyltransferase